MGTRRTGNGDNWPPEGDHSPDEQPDLPDLPELPSEWGPVTVPDDPSELAEEAELVRRELAGERDRRQWPARLGPDQAESEPAIGIPLLIMSVAVLITLISLFAMAWSGAAVPDRTQRDPQPLPAISLTDANGRTVPLHSLTPAVILLVQQCDCGDLIADTIAAAPPGVTVVVVDDTAAPPDADVRSARLLADPDGALRTALGLSPPTGAAATVLLVDQHDQITYTARAASLGTYRGPLAELAP